MQSQVKYRVVGLHENDERVIITTNTTREIAERIVNLMTPGSVFAQLLIESNDKETAKSDGRRMR